jgi:hypothetical protein
MTTPSFVNGIIRMSEHAEHFRNNLAPATHIAAPVKPQPVAWVGIAFYAVLLLLLITTYLLRKRRRISEAHGN